jgi:hypothetical protein
MVLPRIVTGWLLIAATIVVTVIWVSAGRPFPIGQGQIRVPVTISAQPTLTALVEAIEAHRQGSRWPANVNVSGQRVPIITIKGQAIVCLPPHKVNQQCAVIAPSGATHFSRGRSAYSQAEKAARR